MITLLRTNANNTDFQSLVLLLDQHLKIKDGDEHWFFAQFNKVDNINYVVVAYKDGVAVGCGAIKDYEGKTVEIKRMFVPEEYRGQGIGHRVLDELEAWAKELHYVECILETGKKQDDAINLYKKSGYKLMTNYGQYYGVENSVCMKKVI